MSDGDGPAAHEAGEDGDAAGEGDTDAGGDGSETGRYGSEPVRGGSDSTDDGANAVGEAGSAAGSGDGVGGVGDGRVDGHGREPPEGENGAPGDAGIDPSAVDVAALTGPSRELDPRVRLVWALRAALVALVLGGLAGAAGVLTRLPTWVGPAVFTVAFALGVALAVARYRSWSYRVRADSLYLDRGVVTRVQTVVPYVRIQHVDASRGPVERLFGLATVVVYTAGSRGADVSIPGLPPERAEDLQQRLKRLAIAAEGEDAV